MVVRLDNNEVKILLVSEDGIEWGIPKGGIEPQESAESTAIRETFEETGIEVRTLGFLGTFERLSVWWAFPCDVTVEPVPQDHEILSAGYFPIESLPKIDPRQQSIIDAGVERLCEALGN